MILPHLPLDFIPVRRTEPSARSKSRSFRRKGDSRSSEPCYVAEERTQETLVADRSFSEPDNIHLETQSLMAGAFFCP